MIARAALGLTLATLAACAAPLPEVTRLPDGRVEVRGERALVVRYLHEAHEACAARPDLRQAPRMARNECERAAFASRVNGAAQSPPAGCWQVGGDLRCDRERHVFITHAGALD